mgnify:CR=1 FL=1
MSVTSKELIKQQSRLGRTIKRSGDISFSILVLILGSPIILLICLLVKLSSPGPIFYIQNRIGRNFSSFGCIKFRTMKQDADILLSNLLENSSSMKMEFERDFKIRHDPRITKVGRFLRRSSLDELPQFINVLMGEMRTLIN